MAKTKSDQGVKSIVVTGASGGLGTALLDRLVSSGYRVFAAARSVDQVRCASPDAARLVVPVALDVTDQASIEAAAATISGQAGGVVAGLVNMAGILIEGPLELVPFGDFRRQFDVNVLGPFAVTQALLPLLIAGGGRVVNIGAATARTTVPFYGPISASKAALASITDAMRMEFAPFGVKVALVEPGAIETAIFAKSQAARDAALRAAPERAHVYQPAIAAMARALGKSGADRPAVVVDAVMAALTASAPKPRVLVGKGASTLAMLRRLPTGMRDGMLMSSLGLKKALRQAAAQPSRTAV